MKNFWKIINAVLIIFVSILLAGVVYGRENFRSSLEYYTALIIFGTFLVSLLVSTFFRDERISFASAYAGISFMLTSTFAYAIKTMEFSMVSLLFYTSGLLLTFALYNRFEKLKYLDDFWIILLSFAGFWIILLKFSHLGIISLLLAVNTSLLITFLSYSIIEEEEALFENEIEEELESNEISENGLQVAHILSDFNDILIRTFLMLIGVFFVVLISREIFPGSIFSKADIKVFVIILGILFTMIIYGKIFSKKV